MEFEAAESDCSTPSRREKSLGLLTMKFVRLLQEAKDGRLDLKEVSGSAWAVSWLTAAVNVGVTLQMAALEQRAVTHWLAGQVHWFAGLTGGQASRH